MLSSLPVETLVNFRWLQVYNSSQHSQMQRMLALHWHGKMRTKVLHLSSSLHTTIHGTILPVFSSIKWGKQVWRAFCYPQRGEANVMACLHSHHWVSHLHQAPVFSGHPFRCQLSARPSFFQIVSLDLMVILEG